jgi:NADH-quinone oxidoreductase subunit C
MPDNEQGSGEPPAPSGTPIPADAPNLSGQAAASDAKSAAKVVPGRPGAPPAAKHAPKAPATMASTPWEGELPTAVKKRFGPDILECSTYLGQEFFVTTPGAAVKVVEYLKTEAGFDYLADLTAAHYPKRTGEEFDVFYVLYSFSRNLRIRVKTRLAEGASIESVTRVHDGANWLEREAYDMFGIRFEGHPGLKRILMPEDWRGFPLRKDYGVFEQDQRWVRENLEIESGQ